MQQRSYSQGLYEQKCKTTVNLRMMSKEPSVTEANKCPGTMGITVCPQKILG